MVHFVPPPHRRALAPAATDWRRAIVRLVLLVIVAGALKSALPFLT